MLKKLTEVLYETRYGSVEDQALAVLKTIREPTENMTHGPICDTVTVVAGVVSPPNAVRIWHSMMDSELRGRE